MNEILTHLQFEQELKRLKDENERLRLNKETQDNQLLLLTIFNNMGDAVMVKNEESKLILVNDAFCTMLDMSREEIIGRTLAEDIPDDEFEIFIKIDKQVLADGVENINEESLTLSDNKTRIISTRKSRLFDSKGNKLLVGVIRDITEQKKAEESLKKSEAQLKELNKTKDRLFSIIAHDLKSPIGNISTLSDQLVNSDNQVDEATSKLYLGLINSTIKGTLVLLDNLVSWAKTQSGKATFNPELISLNQVIDVTTELSKVIAETKNIKLHQVNKDNIELITDDKMIKTVLRNLISNAIKFTKPGGEIKISTLVKDQLVEISVADNGIGIDKETQKALFNTYTNKTSLGTENEKGSGFGLVLCKEFVEKMGGKIWVKSEEGVGSEFKFTLPTTRDHSNRTN
ncbi:MAG: HAMP domain-containing histidine kinase [Reichenbachiella sp.]